MTFRIATFSLAALGAALLFSAPSEVSAAAGMVMKPVADPALVQNVEYVRKRRWWRSNGYDTDVDAPTTSVRTNNANTDVDAPFTTVRKSPRGTWVRAPFVNLFVPRD
jgi:hypothetical protein